MQIREDLLVEIEALLDDLVAEIEMQKEEGQISDTAASSLLDLLAEISKKLKQAQEDNVNESEIGIAENKEVSEGQEEQTQEQQTQTMEQEEQQDMAEQTQEQNQDLPEDVEVIKIDDVDDNSTNHTEEQKEKQLTLDKTITY